MLGGIYGDKAGSIYEFDQLKGIKEVRPKELIVSESFYSDDTIETIAIIDAITSHRSYEDTLREYILKYENYHPDFKPYFKTAFSPNTIRWAKDRGRSDSIGNGAMMRISPVGYLFDNEDEVRQNVFLATIPTHNSMEAFYSASTIALMIYYFRKGLSKDDVYQKLNLDPEYVPFTKFNTTCSETLNNCLYAIYESTSFEDSIRKALSMGGDTDTNCCIVGSVSEALYGMSEKEKADAKANLPKEFVKVLKRVYK